MKKRISARQRRTKGMKPPLGVARSYALLLRAWLEELQSEILERILSGWERNPVAFSGRFDASEFIGKRISGVRVLLEQRLEPAKLQPQIAKFAQRVQKKNGEEFRRVIGISSADTGLKTVLDRFQERNVGLIKSLAGKQLDDTRELLEKAEIGAWRVEELRKEFMMQFDVTKSKADLLARDQVLKLNGQLAQTRHQNAGITKYIWTTSGDERVRLSHVELDGTLQEWANPPIISEDGRRGHPGDDYQCRCTPFPVLEELT